jgi:hypothetical protein
MSSEGFRILGVAKANFVGQKFPENQKEFELLFLM